MLCYSSQNRNDVFGTYRNNVSKGTKWIIAGVIPEFSVFLSFCHDPESLKYLITPAVVLLKAGAADFQSHF